ncbi:Hypothetical Protein FCC1311_037632 [Hondaea fermentalgiana]|uniref:Uncharacterized protein n=1 Tax=Hondaea fermentalgiana TaxID=2315210 RepID=A0A2R5G962_9STRA|nr:Hypothetical Protein FCC1311_037632 [Hondaea fermentalgiana]|eukprot:GBG27540.1 Hypothetical Protein FCC1311_037632 [Hondaea fermentalgiana]
MIARRVFTSHAQGAPLVAAKIASHMLRECGLPLTQRESEAVLTGVGGPSSQMSEEDFVSLLRRARETVGDARSTAITALRDFNQVRGIDSDYIPEEDLCSAVASFGQASATADAGVLLEAIRKANLKRDSRGHVQIESFVTEILLL